MPLGSVSPSTAGCSSRVSQKIRHRPCSLVLRRRSRLRYSYRMNATRRPGRARRRYRRPGTQTATAHRPIRSANPRSSEIMGGAPFGELKGMLHAPAYEVKRRAEIPTPLTDAIRAGSSRARRSSRYRLPCFPNDSLASRYAASPCSRAWLDRVVRTVPAGRDGRLHPLGLRAHVARYRAPSHRDQVRCLAASSRRAYPAHSPAPE